MDNGVNNVKPGDEAVIIESALGKNGLSVGRRVKVHADNPENPGAGRSEYDAKYADANNGLNDPKHYCPPSPYEKHHTVHGQIWPVTCINGGTFPDVNGGVHNVIDVPDKWLRKVTKTDTGQTQQAADELKVD